MAEEQARKDIDNIIEISKWKMYGEEWEQAETELKGAKHRAIQIRDKTRIDVILDLLRKTYSHEKVPV